MITVLLIIIFVIALSIRLLPMRYGVYMLNEHDPYYQYYMASFIVKEGWSGFIKWFSWGVDHHFWAPWGRDISTTSLPGVAFIGAFLYMLFKPFGINMSLMAFCCIIPPILGALASIAIFFLGKEVEDNLTGLFASIFLALNTAYISRTVFGFFDDESVGILMLIITLVFYIKALKRNPIINGVIAGLALGYMGFSWGAFVYPLNLIALFSLILVLMKRYNRNLLFSTVTTILISLGVVSLIPGKGISYLTSPMVLLPLLAVVTLIVCELRNRLPIRLRKPITVGYTTLVIVSALIVIIIKGKAISLRYLSAIMPWLRSVDPLVRSVAEHAMTPWSHFFMQFGFILILSIACLFLLSQRLNDIDVLLVLMGLLTAYVAANMVRLNLLLAPTFSLLAAIMASRLLKSLSRHIMGDKQKSTTKKAFRLPLSHVLIGIFASSLVVAPALMGFSITEPRSGLPINVAYANSPILMSQDWMSALEWMRENLPKDAVVASWWDHGYWIAIVGNRTSVCDNSTINGTQIRLIARAFLSNETEALRIFKRLGVTHVVVHGIFYDLGSALGLSIPLWVSWGHDYVAISYSAMASIAGFNVSDYIVLDNFGILPQSLPIPKGPKASEATLYRLLYNPVGKRFAFLKDINITRTKDGRYQISYSLLNIPPPQHFKLVYASEPNQYVLIYKVLYD